MTGDYGAGLTPRDFRLVGWGIGSRARVMKGLGEQEVRARELARLMQLPHFSCEAHAEEYAARLRSSAHDRAAALGKDTP